MKGLVAPLAVFVLSMAALVPSALSLSQHPDESHYVWSAGYFGQKAARLDFLPVTAHWFLDPGWAPDAFWSYTQPMGTRFVYALAVVPVNLPGPTVPYRWDVPEWQEPVSLVPTHTLLVTRLIGLTCAALGLALIAHRLGRSVPIAVGLFLLIPHVRDDLARAWAEGPLLLGFGLCALSYGSRWFAVACGVAATFKLTALVIWPTMLLPGAFGRGIGPRWIVLASLLWTALTPPSWFALGPAYLLIMLASRIDEYASVSAAYGDFFGLWLPSRYVWPFELALLLIGVASLTRLAVSRSSARTAPQNLSSQL